MLVCRQPLQGGEGVAQHPLATGEVPLHVGCPQRPRDLGPGVQKAAKDPSPGICLECLPTASTPPPPSRRVGFGFWRGSTQAKHPWRWAFSGRGVVPYPPSLNTNPPGGICDFSLLPAHREEDTVFQKKCEGGEGHVSCPSKRVMSEPCLCTRNHLGLGVPTAIEIERQSDWNWMHLPVSALPVYFLPFSLLHTHQVINLMSSVNDLNSLS